MTDWLVEKGTRRETQQVGSNLSEETGFFFHLAPTRYIYVSDVFSAPQREIHYAETARG